MTSNRSSIMLEMPAYEEWADQLGDIFPELIDQFDQYETSIPLELSENSDIESEWFPYYRKIFLQFAKSNSPDFDSFNMKFNAIEKESAMRRNLNR